jgi:DNA-binding NarL/FixJ family response regulator
MKDETPKGKLRIGLVATDPLRILGLETIFPEGSAVQVVHVSIPGILNDSGVELILIDSDCTDRIFELLATFRRSRPRLKLIVLGVAEDQEHIQQIIGAGAKGYLAHSAKESEIRMAIDIVQDGSIWAPRKVMARLLESSVQESSGRGVVTPDPKFTDREREVLGLLIAGHPNRVIAQKMGIDLITVKAHVGRLMRKVGVVNRIELSVQAVNRNLVLNKLNT